jgi:hypothetical protein
VRCVPVDLLPPRILIAKIDTSAEVTAGRLRIEESPRSGRLCAIMQGIDVALSLSAWQCSLVSHLEAISFGIATLPQVTDPDDGASFLNGDDFGSMAAVAPDRCADRLIQLAADRPRLDALRRTAYETALTRSLDVDTICDRYARLIGQMLHELRTGAYSTPAPVFVHPAFGGRSLPPALQFDPDRIDRGASLEDR